MDRPSDTPASTVWTVSDTTASAPMTEGPGTVIGRYRILEQIGEGGFGVVYVAEQREPVKRRVALKIIKLGMDTRQVVARFEAERQALALMDHPNIAKVLDAGATETGRPYFVMELVRGIRITDYCDQNQLLTAERLKLFVQVCQAIQHAHQKGIIHRDIKPSNILVTLHDGVPMPKVIDFGIAKATQQELTEKTIYTQLQQFVGTPAYMSPEQAEMSGLDIDTRSDIYSLGVLLYELLVGQTPFDAKELLAAGLESLRRTIREQEPVRPSTRLSKMDRQQLITTAQQRRAEAPRLISLLRGDLDWIVMKCLEKDRTRRYETANGLATDILRHLNNEPVMARPPSSAYRFQKAWRRNRVVYSAGLAVAIALVAAVVGISLGLLNAERERARAEQAARRATQASTEAQVARGQAEANARKLETNLYFNLVALAQRESTAESSNVKLAEQLLEDCPARLRNWEWHYLKRRRFSEPLRLNPVGSREIHSVCFSADGRYLAAGAGDGTVTIWDLIGSKLVQTLSAHTGAVASVAFNPANPDLIASAGADEQLRLWEWRKAQMIRSWPCSASFDYGMAYCVAFSPDGRRLAAPGENAMMTLRDTATGREVLRLSTAGTRATMSVAFSSDGRWLATGSRSPGTVQLWDAVNGQLIQSFGGEDPPISSVAFNSDASVLVSIQFDGTVRIWDTSSRQQVLSYHAGNPILVGLALGAQGQRIATGGSDRLVTISDPTTGQSILVLRELASACLCLAFSPGGTRLAAGSRDGGLYVWDATPLRGTEDPSQRTLDYGGEVWTMDVTQDGRSMAFGGRQSNVSTQQNGPVLFWTGSAEKPQPRFPGFGIILLSLAFDPTGKRLAGSGDEALRPGDAQLKVWDLESGLELFPVEAFEGDANVLAVAFSRDGRRLLGAGKDKKIKVWDATTGRKVGVLGEHDREITDLAFSPDGAYLASMGNDDVVRLWDGGQLDRRQVNLCQFKSLCGGPTDLLAFSPDSHRLAVVTDDDTVTIHDLRHQDKAVLLSSRGHRPLAVAFSPDGRWLTSGGIDCSVKVWEAQTGKLRHTFRSHLGEVTRLRFLRRPDGLWLASGSRDGTVKLWSLDMLEDR